MSDAGGALTEYREEMLDRTAESPWRSATTGADRHGARLVRYRYELPVELGIDIQAATMELERRDWELREEDGEFVFHHADFAPSAGLLAEPSHLDALELEHSNRPPVNSLGRLNLVFFWSAMLIFATVTTDELTFIVKGLILLGVAIVCGVTFAVLNHHKLLIHQIFRSSPVEVKGPATLRLNPVEGTAILELPSGTFTHSQKDERMFASELAVVVEPSGRRD